MDFDMTVIESLRMAASECSHEEQHIRMVAAQFFLSGDIIRQKIGTLSEGQKGLLAFANLVLLEPGVIIFDEPTNHINFRHLPAIAEAIDNFEGGVLIVSHDHEFMQRISIDMHLDVVNDIHR